jgi:hypothetical protein
MQYMVWEKSQEKITKFLQENINFVNKSDFFLFYFHKPFYDIK